MNALLNTAAQPLGRPLVIRFGAMGDMVLLTVMIQRLKDRFQSPVDIVASGGWTRPLLQHQPGVGAIYTIRSRRTPYWASREQQALIADLKKRPQGPAWYCDPDDVGRRLLRRTGIADDLVVEARAHPIVETEHFADYWRRIADLTPAGIAVSEDPATEIIQGPALPSLIVPAADRQALEPWLAEKSIAGRELILIQVGNKRTMRSFLSPHRASNTKFWPTENWAWVIAALRQRHPQAAILMLGVAAEHELNESICNMAKVGGVLNVAGDVPVPRLMALASSALGMVSVDTGPAHCAAAVGCSAVVLFGRARPVNYAPRGAGARIRCLVGTYQGADSIRGIAPQNVLQAWDDILARR